jgi:uncharacterized protein YcbK (DUF882 family)
MTTPSPAKSATTRRRLLLRSACAAAWPLGFVCPARADGERRLALVHTHTRERIEIAYGAAEGLRADVSAALDRFLRDHYSGTVGRIDVRLFDLLHGVRRALGAREGAPFEIISGYRAPATNARLRASRGGGVATHSLHMEGRALDIRLPGVPLAELRDAALSLAAGGVGFYEREQFVHVDTGRVRRW